MGLLDKLFPNLMRLNRGRAFKRYFNDSYNFNTFDIPNYRGMGLVQLSRNVNALDMPIGFLSDKFKGGIITAHDKDGNIVENDPLVYRLNNPNHLQGKEEFLAEFYYYLTAAGWNFILPFAESKGFENKLEKNELFNLNPDFIDFDEIKKSPFNLRELGFSYNYDLGTTLQKTKLSTNDIIPFYDLTISTDNPFTGVSRISNLYDELTNTVLADRGKQNKIKRSGAMVLSHKERNDTLSDGLDEAYKKDKDGNIITHKEVIESNLNGSGLAQGKSITVSSKELTGFSLAKDIIGIDFDQMKEADLRTIDNKIGVPYDLLPTSTQQATYINKVQSELGMYQSRIEPVANNLAKSLQEYFNHPNEIRITYDHNPVYQEGKKIEEEGKTIELERVEKLLSLNLIDVKRAEEILTNAGIL